MFEIHTPTYHLKYSDTHSNVGLNIENLLQGKMT